MEDDENFNYEGMERTFVGSLRIGTIAMLKQRPCKINFYSAGKTGKHGAAKAIIKGTDVITDKHIEYSAAPSKPAWLPNVERKSFKFIDIQDDYISVLDDSGHISNYNNLFITLISILNGNFIFLKL